MQEPVAKRKPYFAIGLGAAIALVVLASLAIAYSIINKSYQGNLSKLTAMVAETGARFENGDTTEGATPTDQYKYYLSLDAEIKHLAGILEQLNDTYLLLPGKANEERAGIGALRGKMDALAPGMETFKECIGEDESIAGAFSALAIELQPGQSSDYAMLAARSGILNTKITGLNFFGELENSRVTLAQNITQRTKALDFLAEYTAIKDELSAVQADVRTPLPELINRLKDLPARNDALKAVVGEAGLHAYGQGFGGMVQVLGDCGKLIANSAAYLAELQPVQQNVLVFNGSLVSFTGQDGKFAARLAAWMNETRDLQALDDQLKAVNNKPEYQLVTKRGLPDLGLSPEGISLLEYLAALNAVDNAVSTSIAMEGEIDKLLKDTKLSMVKRISALEVLWTKNETILGSISVSVPDNLAEGLAGFAAACRERAVFLNEYMGYTESKVVADSHSTVRTAFLKEYDEYKAKAATYPADSSERTFYQNLASDKLSLANDQKAKYNAVLKKAETHKKAYEASRKKYVPLLDN